MSTQDREYAQRLIRLQTKGWKRLFDVQAPYRWNLRRLEPGFVLEIGCGIGRNLRHLSGSGVGVDHNQFSVEYARSQGLIAFNPEEFKASDYHVAGRFDSLLLSHVAEHLRPEELITLLRECAPLVREGGKLILICPQERGYASDATHVEFMEFGKMRHAAHEAGFVFERDYSFPFPRWMGGAFIYNEFVSISRKAVPERKS